MKSIKVRLALYFMFIIVITVFILEILLINTVKQNYYKNLEDNMYSQIKVSADLYNRYFSDSTLYDNVLNNVDTFYKQTSAQVQIIDPSGKVLMDSIGVVSQHALAEDVRKALKGQAGMWTGKVGYDDEGVMAVSYPIMSQGNTIGVLRFISTLREVNHDIRRISVIFISIGMLVILISGVVGIILSNSIIWPLREVTSAAEKMAAGNFLERSIKRNDDEIGKLSDTLNYMADEIIKKDQLKNDFISSVSHELRTPLTSIKGWAITLREAGIGEEKMLRDGLDIIEKESDRLTGMVEELLDFSKFVSGKIKLERKSLDIKELMEQVGRQLAPRAAREDITFEVSLNGDVPMIFSDGNRLKQVFINLLDNALKFTPTGGRVVFTAEAGDKNIVFRVIDTGCGISEDELPKVKEKFYKGKSSKSRNGIGLSICDEIIKLMGGSIEIRSEIDRGTEVLVTLPFDEGAAL